MAGDGTMKLPPLDRLGKPGILGLGILIFCLSFYLGNIVPAQRELATLRSEASRLAAAQTAAPETMSSTPASPVAQQLPPFKNASEALKQLGSLAEQHGLTIERATYLLSERDGQRRLAVDLPLKASYASLRAYLRAVLALPAGPALDELILQRPKSSEALIEANVRLSYYFTPTP
jgi:Tfp pilus assembly protein PilO